MPRTKIYFHHMFQFSQEIPYFSLQPLRSWSMLLNLDTSTDAAAIKRKAKADLQGSGRWRDKAKKVLLNKVRKDISALPDTQTLPQIIEPVTKAILKPKVQKSQYSSLFSSNPQHQLRHGTSKAIGPATNAPIDTSSFSGLGLDARLIHHLAQKMHINRPTAIQSQALPYLLSAASASTSSAPLGSSPVGGCSNDILIQSQTGSGKTLTYLLPIVQDLLPLCRLSYINRSVGTMAVVLAPTRELAKQIYDVLEGLLTLGLQDPHTEESQHQNNHAQSMDRDQIAGSKHAIGNGGNINNAAPLTRWMVAGLLTGGATRSHEKARLRKGVGILVATPGRLLDHLQNTESFNVSKCRWLVLDEADRLMDLGFAETIDGIIKALHGRRNLAAQAAERGQGLGLEIAGWDWSVPRKTVLCSATVRDDVEKLAGDTLNDPLIIKQSEEDAEKNSKFTPPSQLAQRYVVVPLKLRLVTLLALLRTLITHDAPQGPRIIVFVSCTAQVDWMWKVLGEMDMNRQTQEKIKEVHEGDDVSDSEEEVVESEEEPLAMTCPLLAKSLLYKLHGSMPLSQRTSSLQAFSHSKAEDAHQSGILICTSVAARGLDLPLVRAVIQYDLPTEGGSTEYIHRVGRTARAGKGGQAWAFVAPTETDWVPWLEARMSEATDNRLVLQEISNEDVLRKGLGGEGKEYETRATDAQMACERWVQKNEKNAKMARDAYQSHLRAYSTHPLEEKKFFHLKHLHLGHVAKSFALREAPSQIGQPSKKTPKYSGKRAAETDTASDKRAKTTTAHRMYESVRQQGKAVQSGSGEFQVADSSMLLGLRP